MNSIGEHSFSSLFKKYRLRSEFENLSDFGDALAQKQLHFENSLFSHWQKGDRMPKDRHLLIIILKIFVERDGIRTLREANEFFAAAGHGYLSDAEISTLPKKLVPQSPFQAPREISYFTGREQYLKQAEKLIINGTPLLINASAGMGKSSTAIRLAHLLREDFPDGVLWYRLDTTSPESVLNAIAMTYGENISSIRNIYNKAAFVRSLLSSKKVLIIFDNLEKEFPLDLILPASPSNAVIVTSRYSDLADKFSLTSIPLDVFQEKETNELFAEILGKTYLKKQKKLLLEVASLLGHLPLALHLIAKQLNRPYQRPEKILKELKEKKLKLKSLIYEDKNLLSSLELVFNTLSEVQKKVFTSLGVFEGADFSLEAVAYINNLTQENTEKCLNELISASLVEYSTEKRYRLHPVIKLYSESLSGPTIIIQTASYYISLIKRIHLQKNYYIIVKKDIDNILPLFKKCVEHNYYHQVQQLWREVLHFFWDTGGWSCVETVATLTIKAAGKNRDLATKTLCYIEGFSWIYYWSGQIERAEKHIREALEFGYQLDDKFLIAYAKQRLGRTLQGKKQFKQSMDLLTESLQYFIAVKDDKLIGNNYRYMAETSSLMGEYANAKEYLYRAISYLDKIRVRFTLVEIYQSLIETHLGALFLLERNYKEAEFHFQASLKIDLTIGAKTTGQIWNNVGLGLVNEGLDDKIKARIHFEKANEMTKSFDLGEQIEHRHIFPSILNDELTKDYISSLTTNKVF